MYERINLIFFADVGNVTGNVSGSSCEYLEQGVEKWRMLKLIMRF